MILLNGILYMFAFFTTCLWITKLVTDCVSSIFGGNLSDEDANRDASIRVILIFLVSLFWTLIIILN